jgi:hypothetical protein
MMINEIIPRYLAAILMQTSIGLENTEIRYLKYAAFLNVNVTPDRTTTNNVSP